MTVTDDARQRARLAEMSEARLQLSRMEIDAQDATARGRWKEGRDLYLVAADLAETIGDRHDAGMYRNLARMAHVRLWANGIYPDVAYVALPPRRGGARRGERRTFRVMFASQGVDPLDVRVDNAGRVRIVR